MVSPNTLVVESHFASLATFPFDKVVGIMTDHIRKMVRAQLSLMYLPYTTKQANAITRLLNAYPTNTEDKERLVGMRQYINNLSKAIEQTTIDNEKRKAIKQYVASLTSKLYDVKHEHIWIIFNDLKSILFKLKQIVDNETKIEVALQYLDKYEKVNGIPENDFETSFIDDVTSCLVFSYPHPDFVIGLENALKVISLYFTPIQMNKMFIDNVEYKIKRYLQEATKRLGKELIDWFRNKGKVEDEVEETQDVAKLYQSFLVSLNRYQTTAKGLNQVLELAHELKQLPFYKVSTLPGFRENMNLVDHISPFK